MCFLAACGRPQNSQENADAVPATQNDFMHGNLGSKLNNYLEQAIDFGFSGAALVVVNDEVILRKGYGSTDATTIYPVTSKTLFNMASMSKSFTAAAILKLNGKIGSH